MKLEALHIDIILSTIKIIYKKANLCFKID